MMKLCGRLKFRLIFLLFLICFVLVMFTHRKLLLNRISSGIRFVVNKPKPAERAAPDVMPGHRTDGLPRQRIFTDSTNTTSAKELIERKRTKTIKVSMAANDKIPVGKTKSGLSPFIYRASEHVNVVSLTYYCSACQLPCKNVTDVLTSTCVGDECLCNRASPIITYPTFFDNSARSTDFMIEAEKQTLGDERLTDIKILPNILKSEITIVTGNKTLDVGDCIQILVKLVGDSGQYLNRGGDDIRVWMIEKKNAMRIAGRVKDFNNGTYLVTIPTLWQGNNSIFIAIPYFREESSTIFRWYRQFFTLFYHYGLFTGNTSQKTLCSVSPNITSYQDVCDLTWSNGGEPWYCGKPTSQNLTCDDLTTTFDHRFIDIGVTMAEYNQFRRSCTQNGRILKELKVKVKGSGNTEDYLPNCKQSAVSKTWNLSTSSGYFNGKRYHPTSCHVSDTTPNVTSCLQNTSLILSGDSTSLQWFKELRKYSNCKLVTKQWSSGKWYEDSICVNEKWNFKLTFIPHNMPFSGFNQKLHSKVPSTKSISTMLDEIPEIGKYIFVLHLYAHFTRQHYNVFRDKILRLFPSLRNALKRNEDLRVAIKGPHIYYCVKWVPNLNDFMGRHLIAIILREMKEFSDRVLYLDFWDMTVAVENKQMHVESSFIWNMIHLLIDHVC